MVAPFSLAFLPTRGHRSSWTQIINLIINSNVNFCYLDLGLRELDLGFVELLERMGPTLTESRYRRSQILILGLEIFLWPENCPCCLLQDFTPLSLFLKKFCYRFLNLFI